MPRGAEECGARPIAHPIWLEFCRPPHCKGDSSRKESALRTGRALSVSGWTVDIACLYTSCTPVAERSNTICWSNDSTHPTRRMPLTRKTETRVAAVRAALRKASCPCRGSSVICGHPSEKCVLCGARHQGRHSFRAIYRRICVLKNASDCAQV